MAEVAPRPSPRTPAASPGTAGDTSWADRESQARSSGNDRWGSFSEASPMQRYGGGDRSWGGGGGWGGRFGGGGGFRGGGRR